MSMSSSLFRHKQSDFSHDVDDLRQQNRYLLEQNQTLKKSLQELITINTQLTQSIQDFNASHVQNFPHINQQQIEQLAHQVIELQQELQRQRQQKKQAQEKTMQTEETIKVIEELASSIREMQEQYQQELSRIMEELTEQRYAWNKITSELQEKILYFQTQYEQVIKESTKKNISNKQLRISTTIQQLRSVLQGQIKQKDQIISFYEKLIEQVQQKMKKVKRN